MKIEIFEQRIVPPEPDQDWFRQNEELVESLAAPIGPSHMEVDLTLIDDEAMARLNKKWKLTEGPTDVLSFTDLIDDVVPQIPGGDSYVAPPGLSIVGVTSGPGREDRFVVGELLIAPEFVETRCLDMGWSIETEYPLLVVHGMLHIVGWEHDTDEQRTAMQDVEEEILKMHGLPHPLRKRS
jgi:probable rRNA maturation factor